MTAGVTPDPPDPGSDATSWGFGTPSHLNIYVGISRPDFDQETHFDLAQELKWAFLLQCTQSRKSFKHAQRFVSKVILYPVQLASSINRPSVYMLRL